MTARWVVVDLEATCWTVEEHPALAADQRNEAETLELGAVRLDLDTWSVVGAPFRERVRPRRHPVLSTFCTQLTGITQADADAAREFPEVFRAWLAWAGGDEDLVLAAWGGFDDHQLRRDASRWSLPTPRWTACNIKRRFSRYAKARGAPRGGWMGLDEALSTLGLTAIGRPHDALDDARNAAAVLCAVERDVASG